MADITSFTPEQKKELLQLIRQELLVIITNASKHGPSSDQMVGSLDAIMGNASDTYYIKQAILERMNDTSESNE